MKKTITASLSEQSLREAASQIQEYKNEVIQKCYLLAKRLAERGVEIASMKITNHDAVYTGELLASMKHTPGIVLRYGGSCIVYTDCPWAKFVEFGTGIVGKNKQHPDTSIVGWKYDVNEHGEAGWYYYRDGKWHWTKGMPSRPFMYETDIELMMEVSKIAKEVFG